ncbi:hypothetical protein G6F46_014119 [Rhizopus delemar]|nr:hypothetical protein G6F46_014119 [Rhizopus delemar]
MWQDERGAERVIAGSLETYKAGIPLRKLATPDDIAHAVMFLLSEQAGHVAMSDLYVDGGATLRGVAREGPDNAGRTGDLPAWLYRWNCGERGQRQSGAPPARPLGRNPVKTAIGLIRQDFWAGDGGQNGPPRIFTSEQRAGRFKMR